MQIPWIFIKINLIDFWGFNELIKFYTETGDFSFILLLEFNLSILFKNLKKNFNNICQRFWMSNFMKNSIDVWFKK